MANLLSCFFVCKNDAGRQITADDADSDDIKRHRSKHSVTAAPPIPKRNSTGSCHKAKCGGDTKLEAGGHHRKSNSVSTYNGGVGAGRISGLNPPPPTRSSAVMEEESFVGEATEWMNMRGGGGGGRRSVKQDVEEGSFVAGMERRMDGGGMGPPPRYHGGQKKSAAGRDAEEASFVAGGVRGARRSANGRMEEVEESFVAGDDWNSRGEEKGKNEKKKKEVMKRPPPRQGVELKSFVAGGGYEASSFKSQNSVSLSEWAAVFKSNPGH